MGELPSSRSGQQLNNLLSLPETLRKRSSCMVDNLELGAPLGRGSYGKVYKGEPCPSYPYSCRLFASTCKAINVCRAWNQPCLACPARAVQGGKSCVWVLAALPQTQARAACRVWEGLSKALGAGKWKGVTVAVKIVEHSAETEGELLQLRESLLSSSIVHPNVVSLSFTLRPVRSQGLAV